MPQIARTAAMSVAATATGYLAVGPLPTDFQPNQLTITITSAERVESTIAAAWSNTDAQTLAAALASQPIVYPAPANIAGQPAFAIGIVIDTPTIITIPLSSHPSAQTRYILISFLSAAVTSPTTVITSIQGNVPDTQITAQQRAAITASRPPAPPPSFGTAAPQGPGGTGTSL